MSNFIHQALHRAQLKKISVPFAAPEAGNFMNMYDLELAKQGGIVLFVSCNYHRLR